MRPIPPTRFLALLLALAWTVAARAHPKPGAHADVRFTVEPTAVRGEFLMNLRFVEGLINWPRQSRDEIQPDEEPPLKSALLEYIGGPAQGPLSAVVDRPNAVKINGKPVAPIIRDLRIIIPAAETRPGFVDVAAAMLPQVLVICEYPAREPIRSVSLVWGTYPRDFLAQSRDVAPLSDIEAVLLAEGDIRPILFKEREPEITWHASAIPLSERFQPVPGVPLPPKRTIPALSLVIAVGGLILSGAAMLAIRRAPSALPPSRAVRLSPAFAALTTVFAAVLLLPVGHTPAPAWLTPTAALPSPAEALAVFQPLHANIYRAFDYTAESDIYDALAKSVDGPLLHKTYDDIYRSLIMHEEGGALSRVRSVEPVATHIDAVALDPASHTPAITVTARWRVQGVVYHWGHSHERTNEYLARYTIASPEGRWRIVDVTPLEQHRVEVAPTLPTTQPPTQPTVPPPGPQ